MSLNVCWCNYPYLVCFSKKDYFFQMWRLLRMSPLSSVNGKLAVSLRGGEGFLKYCLGVKHLSDKAILHSGRTTNPYYNQPYMHNFILIKITYIYSVNSVALPIPQVASATILENTDIVHFYHHRKFYQIMLFHTLNTK